MNIKKIAVTAATAGILLATAAPAFATFEGGDGSSLLIKNKANVENKVITIANTGKNTIFADNDVNGGKIKTGSAVAYGEVTNMVNSNKVNSCACEDGSRVTIKNRANVSNKVVTVANSGANNISADNDVNGGKIKTGRADASSVVTNVVNTNVVD